MTEPTNRDRTSRGETLLRIYAALENRPDELGHSGCTETLLSDMLTDLMHYAVAWQFDFERAVNVAAMYFEAELQNGRP